MGGARSWEVGYSHLVKGMVTRVMTAADLGCAERVDGTLVVLLHRAMIAADIMHEHDHPLQIDAEWSKRWSPWTYSRRHLPPSGF